MKKLLLYVFLVLGSVTTVVGQYTRHIVQFTDKKGTQSSISNPSAYLSARAIQRRSVQHIAIDSSDLLISSVYIDSVSSVPNVTIVNRSKWLNQILISTSDANAINKINSFPFVKATIAIAPSAAPSAEIISKKPDETYELGNEVVSKANRLLSPSHIEDIQYGSSYNQIHIHEGEILHNLGFTGRGITIAILDAGFNSYKSNPAFDSVRLQGRVLGEWDYVMNESSVNEDHIHGANCFSIIASNRPGILVGSAPHASFWLLRTEDAATEFPVEEQNWAAAAEFADSVGADMISTSLGYNIFDNSAYNHTYPQRDGNTTIITRAADLAAHKGMLVTVSAGNDGARADDYKYVSCPADADSVLAVGAVNGAGVIASFSCWGPNSAGKVKPNVVSVGQGTILANTAGNPVGGNGTSYANPNMAGLVACLWQAFPDFTNMEIIQAIEQSADRFLNPDGRYGYGIPNFHTAYDILHKEDLRRKYAGMLTNTWIKAYPVPTRTNFNIVFRAPKDGKAYVQLSQANGDILERKTLDVVAGQFYNLSFANGPILPKGVYFVKYNDGSTKQTIKVMKF